MNDPEATQSHVDLVAVVVSVGPEVPNVLVVPAVNGRPQLPAGPLASHHRTLESGLRSWVEQQTQLRLGYVEQLYTFGDVGRTGSETRHDLSVAYLALVRDTEPAARLGAVWRGWYEFFPWEDWRNGRPPELDALREKLARWLDSLEAEPRARLAVRIELAFGFETGLWSDDRVLDRYELLYEAGLVAEARGAQDEGAGVAVGAPMAFDHRRILATAVSRLRSKIKYRPVIFELMPDIFTLLELQETVEALSGVRLHKPNFRRLVEGQGLVEETGEVSTATGGRPARLVRFRREVLRERPAPGVRLPSTRRG